MVVRYQQMAYGTQLDAVILAVFLQCSYPNANVYHQSVRGSAEVVTITAATASKRYKFQHVCSIFVQRYENIYR